MISFNNVTFKYRNTGEIIKNLSFELKKEDRICFFGASGSGKSTVSRLVMGLEKAKKGAIQRKENITFSVSFQEDRLIPLKTAKENVQLFSSEIKAEELLNELGLSEAKDKLPNELSGGMKRRVSLARALAHESDVLILDEALTGLDSETKALCLKVIEKHLNGRALILITHEIKEAQTLSCRIINI